MGKTSSQDLELIKTETGKDVTKCLLRVPRLAKMTSSIMGSTVETVAVHGSRRDSICVSCCSGCNEGCAYCLTGNFSNKEGLNAKKLNLTAEEITEEFLASSAIGKSRWPGFGKNGLAISFMGKGEPGRNPGQIMEAIAVLYHNHEIVDSSISTIGRLDFFKSFSDAYSKAKNITDFPPPYIGVSIHSPIDSQRAKLARYPGKEPPSMKEIFTRLVEDYLKPNDKEGVLKSGLRFTLLNLPDGEINYSDEALQKLADLSSFLNEKYNRCILVVVATLNESIVSENHGFRSPSWNTAKEVVNKLKEKGVSAHLFGDDKSGKENSSCTCGLLATQEAK